MDLKKADRIVYQLITKENISEIMHLVTEHFIHFEGLIKSIGFNYNEMYSLVKTQCEVNLIEKLSLIAIDPKNNNKIIGFAISSDPKSKFAVDMNSSMASNHNLQILFNLLIDMQNASINSAINTGQCFHLFFLGVLPQYQGKGIAKSLIQLSEVIAQSHGFKYILIEATSPTTKIICDSLGYTTRGKVNYHDYLSLDGKPLSVPNYDSPYILTKHFTP